MICGTPVIGSNLSSIPEIVGRLYALSDLYCVQDIDDKLVKFLGNDLLRTELSDTVLDNLSARLDHTGAGDKPVDALPLVLDPRDRIVNALSVDDVNRHDFHERRMVGLEVALSYQEAIGIARNENNPVASFKQHTVAGQTYPARPT